MQPPGGLPANANYTPQQLAQLQMMNQYQVRSMLCSAELIAASCWTVTPILVHTAIAILPQQTCEAVNSGSVPDGLTLFAVGEHAANAATGVWCDAAAADAASAVHDAASCRNGRCAQACRDTATWHADGNHAAGTAAASAATTAAPTPATTQAISRWG